MKCRARRLCDALRVTTVMAWVIIAATSCGEPPVQDERGVRIPVAPSVVLGKNGDNEGLLYNPASVAIDGEGYVYVLDVGNHRVAVFSLSAEFLRSFGSAGEGPGEFFFGRPDFLTDLAVAGGRLAVVDRTTQRTQLLSTSGEFIDALSTSQVPTSIALTTDSLYLDVTPVEESGSKVLVYSATADGLSDVPVRKLGGSLVDVNREGSSLLNMGLIAASEEGIIKEGYLFWPIIRTYPPDRGDSQVWTEFSWWAGGDRRRRMYDRPEAFVADAAIGASDVRGLVFLDLEYVADGVGGLWIALLAGGVLQAWADDGAVLLSYQTLPEGEYGSYQERVAPGLIDIGVSPGGEAVCGADMESSEVRCYQIPGWR